MNKAKCYLYTLRPQQWVKNFFVFLPLVFAGQLTDINLCFLSLFAFVCFCGISSSVYIFNDLIDLKTDQLHPTKKLRPLPAGTVSPIAAVAMGIILLIISLVGAFILETHLGVVILAYFISNLIYTFLLKKMVIVDVMCIAFFFILRVIAGSVAINVEISHWILICSGLLALFLGFNKRRHEIKTLNRSAHQHRKVLEGYNVYFIDQMISVLTASTVVFYTLYTTAATTVSNLGTTHLLFTVPFVYYGIFRYLYLVHKRGKGGDPARIVLSDDKLILNLCIWLILVIIFVYGK